MRHGSFCRSYHPGRRGTPRLLHCEPLEHRRLLSITVDTLVDEADGSIEDGDVSLRDALAVAPAGETIDFAASLDGGTILLTLGRLEITGALAIRGLGAASLTIDAQGHSRVFSISDGDSANDIDVAISGLTITGGQPDDGLPGTGGGIILAENLTITDCSIRENSGAGIGVFYQEAGGLTVENCTITGNSAGIFKDWGGSLTVTDSVIEENGTGVYLRYTSATITGSSISNNRGWRGGGIHVSDSGSLTVTGSAISGNSAQNSGGGIWTNRTPRVSIASSSITGNSAGGSGGGGIFSYGFYAAPSDYRTTITNCTITGNRANVVPDGSPNGGGGIFSRLGDLTVANSVVSGNSVNTGGGGIAIYLSNLTVTESTISGNSADEEGGGIFTSYDYGTTIINTTISDNFTQGGGGGAAFHGFSNATILGSIVAANGDDGTAPDLLGAEVSFSLVGDNTGSGLSEAPIGVPDADGNLIGDPNGMGIIEPMLGPLADNGGPTHTHALLAGSPAIDAGDPDYAPPPDFDQRGNPRVADGNADGVAMVDMGAFEVLPGDLNGDGEVNGLDVDPFVDVLLSGPPSATADMNADGSVNGLDVDSFVAEVVGGAVPVGALDAEHALSIVDTGSTSRQLRRRQPIHGSTHADDPGHLMHRRTVQHTLTRQSRTGDSVRKAGQRSPPRDMVHDVQQSSWQVVVDLAMRDDTNWDRLR